MEPQKKVPELSSREFNEKINQELVVINFFSESCMPCLMMDPVFESVAESNADVSFGKLDIEEATDVADKRGISTLPCIVIFKSGKEAERVLGSLSEDELNEMIKRHKTNL